MSSYFLSLVLGIFVVLAPCQVNGQKRKPHEWRSVTGPGVDGPSCGPLSRLCVEDATCVGDVCTCPNGNPNGYIDCVPDGWFQCSVIGDPHIDSFSTSLAKVNIPCRYQMSEVITRSFRAATTFCNTKVLATNTYLNGRFYVDQLEIEMTVTRILARTISIDFTVNRNGVEVNFDGDVSNVAWGGTFEDTIRGITFSVTFDTSQNFAVITAERCYVRVVLRPVDLSGVRQVRAPGAAVSSTTVAIGLAFPTQYPVSLCGSNVDGSTLFSDRATELGLDDVNQVIIYDWLDNAVSQSSGDFTSECSASQAKFDTCGARKQGAVGLCADILNSEELNECLDSNSINVMEAFRDCLIGYCDESGTECDASVALLSPCSAVGPATIHDQSCSSY